MVEKKKKSSKKKVASKSKKPAAKKRAAKKAAPKTGASQKPLTEKPAAPKPPAAEPAAIQPEPEFVARALARYVRLSPQKARLVIDLIRGKDVGTALATLRFTRKRAAKPIEKVLRSAVANAENRNEDVDVDRLYVKHAVVNEGLRYKRIRPRMRGMADVYYHRTSHIEIAVAERRPAAGAV